MDQGVSTSVVGNDGARMKIADQKMWLLVDGIVKKLKRARYWTTSADSYNKELLEALSLLENVLKKIEEESLSQ